MCSGSWSPGHAGSTSGVRPPCRSPCANRAPCYHPDPASLPSSLSPPTNSPSTTRSPPSRPGLLPCLSVRPPPRNSDQSGDSQKKPTKQRKQTNQQTHAQYTKQIHHTIKQTCMKLFVCVRVLVCFVCLFALLTRRSFICSLSRLFVRLFGCWFICSFVLRACLSLGLVVLLYQCQISGRWPTAYGQHTTQTTEWIEHDGLHLKEGSWMRSSRPAIRHSDVRTLALRYPHIGLPLFAHWLSYAHRLASRCLHNSFSLSAHCLRALRASACRCPQIGFL